MRIRQINFLMVGGLILLTISLAFTVTWGLGQLQKTSISTEQYYQLRSKVNDQILAVITNYLSSGDSLMLSEAEATVTEFVKTDIAAMDAGLKKDLLPIAQDLQQRLSTDLRAAGKLAGNNTALLEQAETEMMAVLDSLSDYAASSSNLAKREPYQQLTSQLSRAVSDLNRARAKLFATRDQALKADVNAKLQRIADLTAELSALDNLGIFVEEEVDDMADMFWGGGEEQASAEEQGELLKGELNSLVNRYPQELSRTQKQLVAGEQAKNSVNEQLALLQQKMSALESVVLSRRDSIENQVYGIMIVLSIAMVVLAVAVFTLQHWIAGLVSEVNEDMAALADGDFRPREIESTRIVELAGLINSYKVLQQSLNGMVLDITSHSKDIHDASNRVTDSAGMICQFTVDQRQQTERASESVMEVSDSVRHVAEQTINVSAVTKEAGSILAQGQKKIALSLENIETLNAVINKTGEALSTLQSHAQSINGFVEVIQSIAEQTNLLALNAAIEAARAGEQGRGFSVVADEVRSLASKTNEATHEIQNLIAQVSSSTAQLSNAMGQQLESSEETAQISREAGDVYQELIVKVDSINDLMGAIVVQTEQQAQTVVEVTKGIEAVTEKAQTASARSEDTLDVSHNLLGISNAFVQLTQGYRV